MTTASQVLEFLTGREGRIDAAVSAETPLIGSGALNSLALFELTLWIEEQTGAPLDLTAIDIAVDWETPAAVARFIAARRQDPALPPAPPAPHQARHAAPAGEPRYSIVRYRPELAERVAGLRAALLPTRDPVASRDYLAWKYDRNPYRPGEGIYLALSGDEVVGMRGMVESRWETDRGCFAVPCVGDVVIAPAHRNRGLFKQLMDAMAADARKAGYSHVFSLSANRVSTLAALAMGFKAVSTVEARRLAPGLLRGRVARERHRWFGRRDDRPLAAGALGDGLVVEDFPRIAAMAGLVERLGHDGRLRQRRDADYLQWRYANPRNAYSFIYSGGDALDGYIALSRPRGRPRSPTEIVDWEAASGAVAGRLLDAAIACCRDDELSAWGFGLDADKRRILAARGFVARARGPGVRLLAISVLVKALDDDPVRGAALGGRPVFDPRSWDYRMLYSDIG